MPDNGYRGLGHPNKILQADFAGAPKTQPKWFLRLETLVPIDDNDDVDLRKVTTWLGSGNQPDIDNLVTYLLDRVPEGADADKAKKMIAAAFGK